MYCIYLVFYAAHLRPSHIVKFVGLYLIRSLICRLYNEPDRASIAYKIVHLNLMSYSRTRRTFNVLTAMTEIQLQTAANSIYCTYMYIYKI